MKNNLSRKLSAFQAFLGCIFLYRFLILKDKGPKIWECLNCCYTFLKKLGFLVKIAHSKGQTGNSAFFAQPLLLSFKALLFHFRTVLLKLFFLLPKLPFILCKETFILPILGSLLKDFLFLKYHFETVFSTHQKAS